MKKIYGLILMIICLNNSYSQKLTAFDESKHKLIYRMEIGERQLIEFIEFDNNDYEGSLKNFIYKTNRKGIIKDSILIKINIPKSMIKSLMTDLQINGIENVKDCNQIENCIIGLDGTTIEFQSEKKGFENKASFWELNSDYYYNQNNVDLPKDVLQARKLYKLINNRIDLEKEFTNILNRLPVGNYSYGMTIMTKRRN